MSVFLGRDFAQLERVFVAVVRHDVDVRRTAGQLWLYANEAGNHVTAIEYPIHGVTGEDIGNLLLGRQYDER